MPQFTIVSTTAAQGGDTSEMSALGDEFANESEAVGYSRRMAEEMLGLAEELALDFDYSNVAVYAGDLVDEDPDPGHPGFVGLWVLDEEGPAYVTAEEYQRDLAEAEQA